jgi:hypothetical protein
MLPDSERSSPGAWTAQDEPMECLGEGTAQVPADAGEKGLLAEA